MGSNQNGSNVLFNLQLSTWQGPTEARKLHVENIFYKILGHTIEKMWYKEVGLTLSTHVRNSLGWVLGVGCYVLYHISCYALEVGQWAFMVRNWVLGVLYQVCWMLHSVCHIFSVECWVWHIGYYGLLLGVAGWEWCLWGGMLSFEVFYMGWL